MTPLPQITTGLARIGAVIRSQAWQQAGPLGVTPTQSQILVLLHQRGPMRVGRLAEELGITQPTASDAVKSLVGKQLVARRRSLADGRAAELALTEAGVAMADRLAQWPDAMLGALEVLDDEERAVLLKVLVKVIRQLQVQQLIPTQRVCATCMHFRPNVHDGPQPHHCDYLNTAFGDGGLRTDCAEHEPAGDELLHENWQRFVGAADD